MSTDPRYSEIRKIDEVTVATFSDTALAGAECGQNVLNGLFTLVVEDGGKKIVLDLSHVEYLSSAAAGKLITLDKKLKAANAILRLCCVRPNIFKMFVLARFDKYFDIKPTLEEALDGF